MTRKEIESLFKTHYTQMYHLALTLLFDEARSKDVVSGVFASLLSGKVVMRADNAKAFLMASVRHRCLNVLQHMQVQERFAPMSLKIFRLRYLQEMTCQEVAEALNVSRQTVHTHLKQSVEKIRKYFNSSSKAIR